VAWLSLFLLKINATAEKALSCKFFLLISRAFGGFGHTLPETESSRS